MLVALSCWAPEIARSAPPGWSDIVGQVFACEPAVEDAVPDEPLEERHYSIGGLQIELAAVPGLSALRPLNRYVYGGATQDEQVQVRLSVERLGERTLQEAIAWHQGRDLGPDRLTPDCRARLRARYEVPGSHEVAVGHYRSRIAYRVWKSEHVLYARVDSQLVVLRVALRWSTRASPRHGTADRLLASLKLSQ